MKMRMKDILILESVGVEWDKVEIVKRNYEYIRIRDKKGREFDVRY